MIQRPIGEKIQNQFWMILNKTVELFILNMKRIKMVQQQEILDLKFQQEDIFVI